MGSFTKVFGGTNIYPADVSYLGLPLTGDVSLFWPTQAPPGQPVVARIIDVAPAGAYSIVMPDATQASPGEVILYNNLGPFTVTVRDNANNVLASLVAGSQWELYLVDNTTAAGVWRVFRFGAATAQAQASALAGPGLVALGSQLGVAASVTLLNSNYTVGVTDRATAFVWTGALGTIDLPPAGSVGNNFNFEVRNGGSGNLTLVGSGSDKINGAGSLVLQPGDSASVITDGSNWYTVGLGQQPIFAFDYTTIDLTGKSSPYALSGSELNRIAYLFVGTLTGNMVVEVPPTTQQYWLGNNTTGGTFTLKVGTPTQVTPLSVNRGSRGIYYCDGSNLVNADTQSISFPVSVADGGTGATTAGAALVNLGGGTVGISVFEAPDQATAQAAIGVTTNNEDAAIVFSIALG